MQTNPTPAFPDARSNRREGNLPLRPPRRDAAASVPMAPALEAFLGIDSWYEFALRLLDGGKFAGSDLVFARRELSLVVGRGKKDGGDPDCSRPEPQDQTGMLEDVAKCSR